MLGEILSFGLWVRREGYRESTIQPRIRALKAMSRRADLLNPESVKAYLASSQLSENPKEKLCDDPAGFNRYEGIHFDRPRYRRVEKLPLIPLQSEIDQLISGVGKKTATFLQLLKETAIRLGEAWNLRWINIDCEKSSVSITPEKGSNPRQFKISSRLAGMLQNLSCGGDYIFRSSGADPLRSMKDFSRGFFAQRKHLAEKLLNPRLNAISFKTIRHFKATMEHNRTKDILHVMHLLRHKNIRNTLVYTHLVDFGGDEYVCKVAKTVDDAKGLIESGFDYVTDVEGMKLFRKRK